MANNQRLFYLLAAPSNAYTVFPDGERMNIPNLLTIGYPDLAEGRNAVAIFVSRLDAEIYRHYANQMHGDRDYVVLDQRDVRVRILTRITSIPCYLVTAFLLDAPTHRVVVDGGLPSLASFILKPDDRQWLLDGAHNASPSIMASVSGLFSAAGGQRHLDDLMTLESLSEESLANLARLAVNQRGVVESSNRSDILAVFSPARMAWITLTNGGRHESR